MPKYIGLTIGPIIDTMSKARSTGELWGTSYIFSYIMKNIILRLKTEIVNINFIIPSVEEDIFSTKQGIGLFHDRLIFETDNEDDDFKILRKIIDDVFEEISENILKVTRKKDKKNQLLSKSTIIKYLKEYFQIQGACVEIDNGKIIDEVSKVLDYLELKSSKIVKIDDEEDYLMKYLSNDCIKESLLIDDAYRNDFKGFPMTLQIATNKFCKHMLNGNNYSSFKDEESYIRELSKCLKNEGHIGNDNRINKAYKYFAVVQSDGDNIGQVVNSLKEKAKDKYSYKQFSHRLFNFAIKSNELITDYDGFTIYAGGDDLLFFAPLLSEKGNLFELLKSIKNVFAGEMKPYLGVNSPKPSLSFGVSIIYYKDPLSEAMETARNELFQISKNHKSKINNSEKYKNSIAIKLEKHSGFSCDIVFNQDSESYSKFIELLNISLNNISSNIHDNNDRLELLSSIQHKIHDNKSIIECLMNNNDFKMIRQYFKSSVLDKLNEIGKKSQEKYVELFIEFFEKYKKEEIISNEQTIESLYSVLKLCSFFCERGDFNE